MSEDQDLMAELEELKTTLGQIRGLEEQCREAGQRVANIKFELKSAREAYDEAVIALRSAIRERDEVLPLFDQQPPATVAEDAWRAVTIEDAGIPLNICALLRDHKPKPIETIGDIADFTSVPTNYLTDIQGVGPAKATAIDEAIERFWRENPQYTELEVESDETEDDEEELQ